MKTFEELQEELGYNEITTGRNGYPSNIYRAISCDKFDNFEQLKEFAEANKLTVILIHQKNGWHLWENKGEMYKPFETTQEDFGDNYEVIEKLDEEEFIENEVKYFFEDDIESFEEIEDFLKTKKEIWQEIDKMESDEVVVTHEGNYYETFKQFPMCFSEDTHTYSYALIED